MDGEGWERWYLLLEAAGLINLVLFSFINLLNKMYWLYIGYPCWVDTGDIKSPLIS